MKTLPEILLRLFLTALLVAIPFTTRSQSGQELKEMQVKAAYLYNFTKFVYWNTRADVVEPVTIGLIKADNIAFLLEDFIKTRAPESGVMVKRINSSEADLADCQFVYIDQSQKDKLTEILKNIKDDKVLTVSDIYGFARRGGMIGFFQEDGHIKIEINLTEVNKAGLEVSAKLMEVARIVK
ncbi:MAG: YfiR family protein [Bacteroidota bacterium]